MRCWYPSCFEIDLKDDRNKHGLSRYKRLSDYIYSITTENGQANHAIASFAFSYRIYHLRTRSSLTIQSTRATILAYGQGVGLDVQLFLFNRGDCIVAREFSLWIKNKPQYQEINKSLNGCKATIGAFIFIKKTINTKSANNRSVRIRKRKALNGYLLSLLNNIF